MHQKRLLKNENFKPWIISVQEPVAIWIQIEFANLMNSIQFKMQLQSEIQLQIPCNNNWLNLLQITNHYFSSFQVS